MLPLAHRIAFSLFAVITLVMAARGFARMYRRIARGRRDPDRRTNDLFQRAWYALRTTLLQERTFRKRPWLSLFHSFIFYAFVLYVLVNALDLIDGFVSLPALGLPIVQAVYGLLTDALSVLAIVGVVAFVLRRYALPSRSDLRFNKLTLLSEKVKRGYIQRDSAIVSAFIVFHIGSRIVGNSARLAMEGADRWQPFGNLLAPVFAGPHAMAWRIFGYWGALGSVLLFLSYFPYSKHVHLLMAPLKYLLRRDVGSGTLPAASIDLEAAQPEVGAAQLADLSWPRLLDAYACIQCNRCQDVCPASQTGKSLSPAALEINKRMALNAITEERSGFSLTGAAPFETGTSAGPNLLQAIISPEAVWACTTCGACMQVCPTQDEQMLDIIDIRRNLVMIEGEFPSQLQTAFRGMERASNPWGIAREKRMAWAEGLAVPTLDEVPEPEVLYWVGCAASYDASAQKTARAMVNLLTEAKVSFAVLGKKECCTGDSARRAGNELLYQEMAGQAIGVLTEARPKRVVASCPHCVNAIGNEFPQLGGNFEVVHHTELLEELVRDRRLAPVASEATVTFHDPCYLGRHRGSYEQPRAVLHTIATSYVEMPRAKSNAFCCGAGGAQFWKEEERGEERVAENRFREANATLAGGADAKVLAVGCPFCKSMLGSTRAAGEANDVAIKDVAELLWEGVQRSKGLVEDGTSAADSELLRRAGLTQHAPVSLAHLPTEASVSKEVIPTLNARPGVSASSTDALTPPLPTEQPKTPIELRERKKWTPKASGAPAVAPVQEKAQPTSEAIPVAVEPSSSAEAAPSLPAQPRKKWAPKSASSESPDTAPTAPAPEPSADLSTQPAETATPQRKKWQPGKPKAGDSAGE